MSRGGGLGERRALLAEAHRLRGLLRWRSPAGSRRKAGMRRRSAGEPRETRARKAARGASAAHLRTRTRTRPDAPRPPKRATAGLRGPLQAVAAETLGPEDLGPCCPRPLRSVARPPLKFLFLRGEVYQDPQNMGPRKAFIGRKVLVEKSAVDPEPGLRGLSAWFQRGMNRFRRKQRQQPFGYRVEGMNRL
jgi:hypothetical protein